MNIEKIDENPKIKQIDKINDQIDNAIMELQKLKEKVIIISNPDEMEKIEKEIIQKTDNVASLLTGQKIQQSIDSEEMNEKAKDLISQIPKKMKNQGPREVNIKTARGSGVTIKAPYYSPKKKKRRKKKTGKIGLYPSIMLIGIHDHLTPNLGTEISMLSVILSSFEETQRILIERGVSLDLKKIRTTVRRFAKRAQLIKQNESIIFNEYIDGRQIIISTDGGRIRIRKKKSGPKTKKNRNRYSTKWREPKLLIIYIAKKGEMDHTFLPIIDGVMKGPDAIFNLIEYYLRQLKIVHADKILFVADGAKWIWNRVPILISKLGLPINKFYTLVDFYHVVEHLGKVAKLKPGWKTSKKKKWIKANRNLLLKGSVSKVIANVLTLCKGRNSKKIRREKNYFVRNQKRMQYKAISELELPIGSGAMESAIRRVVNLKLKGASIYWLEETAEAMLLLRSFYKSGRWETLKKLSFSSSYVAFM